jgi:hypothetical protein
MGRFVEKLSWARNVSCLSANSLSNIFLYNAYLATCEMKVDLHMKWLLNFSDLKGNWSFSTTFPKILLCHFLRKSTKDSRFFTCTVGPKDSANSPFRPQDFKRTTRFYKLPIWLIYLHLNGTARGQHTHFSFTYSIRRHVQFISVVQILDAIRAGLYLVLQSNVVTIWYYMLALSVLSAHYVYVLPMSHAINSDISARITNQLLFVMQTVWVPMRKEPNCLTCHFWQECKIYLMNFIPLFRNHQ